MSDDEEYIDEDTEVYLGVGSAHAVSDRPARKLKKNPIGFVHFPDEAKPKARKKAVKRSTKRRKRC